MVKPHVDIRIKLGPDDPADGLEKTWVELWNITSDVFAQLAQQGISAHRVTTVMLVAFGRALANETEVPGEVAWLNVLADPRFKAGFLTSFDTQQEFARRVEELHRTVEEEEPPVVRH